MDESSIQSHLRKLSTQSPPAAKQASTRELVIRYFDDIAELVIQGWSWDAIAEGFQGNRGTLKGTTIRRYFNDRKRTLAELEAARRLKRRRASNASPTVSEKPPVAPVGNPQPLLRVPEANDPFAKRSPAINGELVDS